MLAQLRCLLALLPKGVALMNRAVRALKFGILVSLLSRIETNLQPTIVAVLAAWALWDVKL